MDAKTVLAIDPGSKKCGLALVRRQGTGELKLLWRAICARNQLMQAIGDAGKEERFSLVIVGDGTRSKDLVGEIREHIPGLGILVIDEKETTLVARERYWQYNQRRGWRRFVPSTLQTPPEPYDDFVALILAERVLEN